MVVPDVRAFGGCRTRRYPPQPEHADDVVDAQAARMPQRVGDKVAERCVAEFGQSVRSPRGLVPVLAGLTVRVRRRADGDALRQRVLPGPGVGPGQAHADGQVVHDPEPHAGAPGGGLGVRELLVQDPLEPAVEVDFARMRRRELGHRGRARVPQLRGPFAPVAAVLLTQPTPGGEVVERLPLPAAEGRVREGPAEFQTGGVDELQCGPLGRPGRVTFDALAGRLSKTRAERVHLLARGGVQVGVLGDALDA
jgi:hypothetical protein